MDMIVSKGLQKPNRVRISWTGGSISVSDHYLAKSYQVIDTCIQDMVMHLRKITIDWKMLPTGKRECVDSRCSHQAYLLPLSCVKVKSAAKHNLHVAHTKWYGSKVWLKIFRQLYHGAPAVLPHLLTASSVGAWLWQSDSGWQAPTILNMTSVEASTRRQLFYSRTFSKDLQDWSSNW